MDWMQIVLYIVGIVFNIGAVAAIRGRAYERGKKFLASGRFAVIAVFLLCFAELLVTGRFEALQSQQMFMDLITQAATMALATTAVHAGGKTLAEAATATVDID